MSGLKQFVYIIEDDVAVIDSLKMLLDSYAFETRTYLQAESFLEDYSPEQSGCLLLDINLPAMSGLELQSELLAIGSMLPIIFVTGFADVPTAVQALKSGAFEFLQKPYDDRQLLHSIRGALEHDARTRAERQQQQSILERLKKLTPRETEVLNYIIDGHPNKVIAIELDLSQRTVEIYRSNVMQKMQAGSLAQLVKLVTELPNLRPST